MNQIQSTPKAASVTQAKTTEKKSELKEFARLLDSFFAGLRI